ncbi:MAG: rhamnulokinase [Candidatus Sumerlaeia bacterium]|nr:rhamnulokinase [Candidatus Sumerlaeia bacterium]
MSGSGKRFLAFDLGAESGRAVVGLWRNNRIELEEIHRFPTGATEILGTLYWDVLAFHRALCDSLALYARRFGRHLDGIGVDTWGVDFALLDRTGALVANPVHYRDARTEGMWDEAFRRMPREEIFRRTGIQFMPFNTLYQLLSLVVKRSPWLETAHTLLLMPSLFNYFLTGVANAEFTHATTTQVYDPREGKWSEAILTAMGIPRAIFPEIVAPGTILGPLRQRIADDAGLDPVCVIAPATHDTASAVAAVPAAPGDDWAYLSSGTWSLMGIETPEPIINQAALCDNLTNEGGVGRTFRFLKNISGLWMVQECRRRWAKEGREYSYDDLTALAGQSRPFAAFLDPDAPLFLNPDSMPAAVAEFCRRTGQKPPETHGEFIRSILESLALRYREVLDTIRRISGRAIRTLHIVGGGSRNRLLNQFTADALGIPVVAGPSEATALGNVLVQAMACGELASHAEGRSLLRETLTLETFEPRDTARWDEASARRQAVLSCTRG